MEDLTDLADETKWSIQTLALKIEFFHGTLLKSGMNEKKAYETTIAALQGGRL
jgi:hypothetical protein